jgi:hypothetical protein
MGLGEMGLGEMVLGEMVLGDMDIHHIKSMKIKMFSYFWPTCEKSLQ